MLFARGGALKRQRLRAPDGSADRFRCSGCSVPIPLERVVTVNPERTGHGVTGYVLIQHSCLCTPQGTRSTRSWGTHAAFCVLFGSQPWLPYRAPFRFRPLAEDEPSVLRWRWELAQVADADEFLLFLEAAAGGNAP